MNAKQPRRSMTEAQLVAVVEAAAQDGSWNAAAWLLERRFPERWIRPSVRTPPSAEVVNREPEPEPEADPFAQVVSIAQRRRGKPR